LVIARVVGLLVRGVERSGGGDFGRSVALRCRLAGSSVVKSGGGGGRWVGGRVAAPAGGLGRFMVRTFVDQHVLNTFLDKGKVVAVCQADLIY
jgi:hypothetical protein